MNGWRFSLLKAKSPPQDLSRECLKGRNLPLRVRFLWQFHFADVIRKLLAV
jgi:hypothetical protein